MQRVKQKDLGPEIEPIPEKLLLQSRNDLQSLLVNSVPKAPDVLPIQVISSVPLSQPLVQPVVMPSDLIVKQPTVTPVLLENLLEPVAAVVSPEISKNNPKMCANCGGDLLLASSPVVYLPGCGHSVHMKCLQKDSVCPLCNPRDIKRRGKLVLLDHGNDPRYTKLLEQEYGRQGAATRRTLEDAAVELTFIQKNKLTPGVMDPMKIKKSVIDKNHLVMNHITIDKILETGVSFVQMYYVIGLRRFNDLLELGLSKEHFQNVDLVSVATIVQLYKIDKDTLEKLLDIRLKEWLEWGYEIRDLATLGWTMDEMIGKGITRSMFKSLAMQNNAERALVRYLKMNKTHLSVLGIKAGHMKDWKWDTKKVKKYFKISVSLDVPSEESKSTQTPVRATKHIRSNKKESAHEDVYIVFKHKSKPK